MGGQLVAASVVDAGRVPWGVPLWMPHVARKTARDTSAIDITASVPPCRVLRKSGVIIVDKLASYVAAKREVLPSVEHRQHCYLNNRAENAHQPTRQRERQMRRFKSPGHAQRFLAAHGPIAGHFRPRRHRLSATAYRQTRNERFATWRAVTGLPAAA